MDKKCPYCGAETRPGDNFCLNCGNRLLSTTPSSSSQQVPSAANDTTLATPDNWAASGTDATVFEENAPTIADAGPDPSPYRTEVEVPTAQATLDKIEQPARFILRSDSGEIVQEYPLDKLEISIGRAPNSDILLSKDKLTSRRHATVHYEHGQYVLRDERSANGTFVNGQQIEEMVPLVLKNDDHIGIGEHELIFRAYGTSDVENWPTVSVAAESLETEMTYRTREDELATAVAEDDFRTSDAVEEPGEAQAAIPLAPRSDLANGSAVPNIALPVSNMVAMEIASAPLPPPVQPIVASAPAVSPPVNVESHDKTKIISMNLPDDVNVNLALFTNISQPVLPDMTALMAALSTLDGQVMSLQEQFNATQESMRNHEAEIANTTNQLRAGLRRVSDRMDSTIADVARSREALSWSELLQLMEDVMNNPRDIEYVTKLARKARELNKVFQLHQNVLNTMAECNSLLRGMIGEER